MAGESKYHSSVRLKKIFVPSSRNKNNSISAPGKKMAAKFFKKNRAARGAKREYGRNAPCSDNHESTIVFRKQGGFLPWWRAYVLETVNAHQDREKWTLWSCKKRRIKDKTKPHANSTWYTVIKGRNTKNEYQEEMMEGKTCNCPCHKGVGGWLVVIFGLSFLLQNLQIILPELANIIWPSAIILMGLKMSCRCCGENHGMN